MKKLFSIVTALAIGAGAYTLNLNTGWQLKGALSDINVSELNNSNIISVWTYDSNIQKWRAYIPNSSIDLSKYGIENLQKIEEGEGFWINAKSNVSINIASEINNSNYDNEYQGQSQSSLSDILSNLGFTPLPITSNDFDNKLVLTQDDSAIFFSNDGNYTEYEEDEGGEPDTGKWQVEDNVLVMNNALLIAIKDKNGSLVSAKGYNIYNNQWFTNDAAILNATENTTVNSASDYLALFDPNTQFNSISESDFADQTKYAGGDTFVFNSDGTFTDEENETVIGTGTWSVEDNKVLVMKYNSGEDSGKTAYVVFIGSEVVYIDVDSNGKIIGGGVDTLNN